ncbi:hypothetical protein KAR91_67025 [Candidatus Pacearchaeota archaeon]|nr:hypothetical protein [Candidatus Pacearchaeota archaeon]
MTPGLFITIVTAFIIAFGIVAAGFATQMLVDFIRFMYRILCTNCLFRRAGDETDDK